MEISPGIFNSSSDQTFTSKAIRKPLQACTPISDRRFSINATDYAKYTLIVYTSDIQNPTGIDEEPPNINEVPSHIDSRKVFFNCGLVAFLFMQPDDIPLLPFQPLLQRRPALSSHTKDAMLERAKSKPTSPKKTRTRALSSNICTALPHTIPVPRPSLYSCDIASQRGRTTILIRSRSRTEEDEEKSCRISYIIC